jgi:F0F1-type ATP synthase membrane subunit b/b'
MKSFIKAALIFTLGAVIAAPSFAFAAEEAAASEGTWLGTMFFAINFALFAGILIYYAVPAAGTFFRDRASGIRAQIERLNSALQEARDLANRAAARMAQLDHEIAQIKAEMENETAFIVKRIRDGAAITAERIHHDSELTSAATIDAAQRRVRERLAMAAATLARELIARSFEASDQARLIDSFMDKIQHEAVP